MAVNVELKALIEHCVHFGHRTCFWNPKMAPYIYGKKSRDLHIINLLKTRALFQKALNEIDSVAANNGKVLFVSTKRVAQVAIEQAAKHCEMPYVSKRWPGGMLTNFKTILRSVKKMKQLEGYINTDEFSGLKKKERLSVQRELDKLQASFNGIRDMGSLPDMLFVIDVGHEHIAIKEGEKLGIPIVGIVDTNCSPEGIDYIIPGNDDSQKAISLYTRLTSETIYAAREKIRAKIKTEEVKLEGKTKVRVVKKVPLEQKVGVESFPSTKEKVAEQKGDSKTSEVQLEEKSILPERDRIIRVAVAKKVSSTPSSEKKSSGVSKKTAIKTKPMVGVSKKRVVNKESVKSKSEDKK